MSLRVLLGCLLLACLVASVGAVDLSWTDTGQVQTENVDLTEGLVYLSVSSTGPYAVMVNLKDAEGNSVDTALNLEGGYQEASWAFRIETEGAYYLDIKGYSDSQEWTVSMTDPPEDDDPDAGPEWIGMGMESTGLFALDAGTVQLVLSSPAGASAELLDDQGRRVGGVVLNTGDVEASKELAIESDGQYIINVDGRGNSEEWTVSVVAEEESVPKLGYSWIDSGDKYTDSFTLTPRLAYLTITSAGQVSVQMLDDGGQQVDKGHLMLLEGNGMASKAVTIETGGAYHLSISGDQEWTVNLTDPPAAIDPEKGMAWAGKGVQSTGLFWLDQGTARLALTVQGLGYALLLDEQGAIVGSVAAAEASSGTEQTSYMTIPVGGQYLVNVEVPSTSGQWMLSVTVDQKKATGSAITPGPTVVPATPTPTTVSRFGARRYLVGTVPLNPPVGISVSAPEAVPTRTQRQFGAGSTSFSPPKGKFQRWYPVTRWRTGR